MSARRDDSIPALVVGAGLMGRWHADSLTRAGARLTAVVDLDARAAHRLARRFPPAIAVDELDEALAGVRGGVVHICTPLESHVPLTQAALRAGAHVLVEKPLARDLASSERLLDLAEQSGVMLCPCHQYVFQRGTAMARRALLSIGPLIHAEATALSAGGRRGDRPELDRVASEILPHPLSVLQALLPGSVDTADWRAVRPGEGEVRAEALIGGASVSIAVSMNGRPPRNELRLIGARGTVDIDFFHGFAVVQRAQASRAQKIAMPFRASALTASAAAANLARRAIAREPAYPGLRALVGQVYAAAGSNGPSPIPRRDAIAVAAARDSVIEALDLRDEGAPPAE